MANNFVHGCDWGVYTQPSAYYSYLWAANNTFSGNGTAIFAAQTARGGVWNNIFIGSTVAAINCYSLGYTDPFIPHARNDFYGNYAHYSGQCFPVTEPAENADFMDIDPMLGADGLHLQPGSPMIDSGLSEFLCSESVTKPSPLFDYDGEGRPRPVDIGADEY